MVGNIYMRQLTLPLRKVERVAVIGVGGAGSWAAVFLALAGVPWLALVDPDVVEEHNLNRLPLPPSAVGRLKVEEVAKLIKRLRPSTRVDAYPVFAEEAAPALGEGWVVVDARDRNDPLPPPLEAAVEARYDGMHVTVTLRPAALGGDFDTEPAQRGYTAPSWVGGAAMAGLLAALAVLVEGWEGLAGIISFDEEELPLLLGNVKEVGE